MKIQKKKAHSSFDSLLTSKHIHFIDKNKAQAQIKGGHIIEDDVVVF